MRAANHAAWPSLFALSIHDCAPTEGNSMQKKASGRRLLAFLGAVGSAVPCFPSNLGDTLAFSGANHSGTRGTFELLGIRPGQPFRNPGVVWLGFVVSRVPKCEGPGAPGTRLLRMTEVPSAKADLVAGLDSGA